MSAFSCPKDILFWTRGFSLRTVYLCALCAHKYTLSAQSVFCDVHAAKNGLDLFRGFRASNSARLCHLTKATPLRTTTSPLHVLAQKRRHGLGELVLRLACGDSAAARDEEHHQPQRVSLAEMMGAATDAAVTCRATSESMTLLRPARHVRDRCSRPSIICSTSARRERLADQLAACALPADGDDRCPGR